MQKLQKENKLMNDYIVTLQKQNEAKNIERYALLNEINQMQKEIIRLNDLISKSNIKSSINTISNNNISEK